MDPDMVRQQEEAEAESLLFGIQTQPLCFQHSLRPENTPTPTEALSSSIEIQRSISKPDIPPARHPPSVSLAAIYNAMLTAAGLAGGIMAGVKLQLVDFQSLGVQALSGFFLGGQGTATYLRRRGVAVGKAYRTSFSTTAMVLASEAATLTLAHRYSVEPLTGNPADANAIYALTLGGGALVSIFLAFIGLKSTLR